jgi:ribonuclease HII
VLTFKEFLRGKNLLAGAKKNYPVRLLCGLDEAGRGPLAGPVVAAAVVLDPEFFDPRIKDSKKLSPKERETLAKVIWHNSWYVKAVAIGAKRIDEINILQASLRCMSLAARSLKDVIFLVDGNASVPDLFPQHCIIGGDNICLPISAASIIAKVVRDQLMVALASRYPGYYFEKHKGYPTKAHRHALALYGASPVHRLSFAGVS